MMKRLYLGYIFSLILGSLIFMPFPAKAQSIRMVRPDSNGFFDYSKATKGDQNSRTVACIGFVDGRFEPGKTQGGWNNCNVPWGNKFVEARNFYIVNGGRWVKAEGGFIPPGAFNAADRGDSIYICLAWVGSSWETGKTVSGWRNCNIAWGNRRVEARDFWVLRQ
jgi:hypothetical protein